MLVIILKEILFIIFTIYSGMCRRSPDRFLSHVTRTDIMGHDRSPFMTQKMLPGPLTSGRNPLFFLFLYRF
jgi:hypothetical protein